MDSFVSRKDETWFLRVCHHIFTGLYYASEWVGGLSVLVFNEWFTSKSS